MSASNMALLFWVKQVMPETRKAFREHEGMLVVSGRAMEGMKHFGPSFLPALMAHTIVA